MNAAKGFKDEESGILDEVLQTSDQKEVVHKNLTGTKTPEWWASIRVYTYQEQTAEDRMFYKWAIFSSPLPNTGFAFQ